VTPPRFGVGGPGPCPHCGALAQVERSSVLQWRCGVCGGPVVPTQGAIARSNSELASLVGAQRARGMALGWTAAAFLFGAIGAAALGLAPILWFASHIAAFVFAALGGIAALLWAASARGAAQRNAEARAKLDDAWTRVAGEVIRGQGAELTAPELARAMNTDDVHAERLLTLLSTGGRVTVAVRDDAELSYRVAVDDPAELTEPGGTRGRAE
jgi:MFS family permease